MLPDQLYFNTKICSVISYCEYSTDKEGVIIVMRDEYSVTHTLTLLPHYKIHIFDAIINKLNDYDISYDDQCDYYRYINVILLLSQNDEVLSTFYFNLNNERILLLNIKLKYYNEIYLERIKMIYA